RHGRRIPERHEQKFLVLRRAVVLRAQQNPGLKAVKHIPVREDERNDGGPLVPPLLKIDAKIFSRLPDASANLRVHSNLAASNPRHGGGAHFRKLGQILERWPVSPRALFSFHLASFQAGANRPATDALALKTAAPSRSRFGAGNRSLVDAA